MGKHCTYTLLRSTLCLSHIHKFWVVYGVCFLLWFLSRSMAVNLMRIFFCYYNQTWSFFACSSVYRRISSFRSTFFFHFSFFGSLRRSSVIRIPILIHNAICSCFLDCFVESVYKCRRCEAKKPICFLYMIAIVLNCGAFFLNSVSRIA